MPAGDCTIFELSSKPSAKSVGYGTVRYGTARFGTGRGKQKKRRNNEKKELLHAILETSSAVKICFPLHSLTPQAIGGTPNEKKYEVIPSLRVFFFLSHGSGGGEGGGGVDSIETSFCSNI